MSLRVCSTSWATHATQVIVKGAVYKVAKTVEDDPEFDARRAQQKLRRFVEGIDHAIRLKAEIMVDHFHDQVLAQGKIGGAARAMVVTNGIERAIQYCHAIRDYLAERKSRYQALIAFSGEHELGGAKGHRGVAERPALSADRRAVPGGSVPLRGVRGGTTGRTTRPTRRGWRSTTCGAWCCHGGA